MMRDETPRRRRATSAPGSAMKLRAAGALSVLRGATGLHFVIAGILTAAALAALALLFAEVRWLLHLRTLNATVAASVGPTPAGVLQGSSRTPDSPGLAFAVGYAAARAGQHALALSAYREAARAPEFAPAVQLNIGNLHARRALQVREDTRLDALARRAAATHALSLAREAYREALRLDPGLWDAKYNLERVLRLAPDDDTRPAASP